MKLIKRSRYYNKFEPFILFIKVDESCNLRCEFCYQKAKKPFRLDTEEKFKRCFQNLDAGIDKFLKYTQTPDYEYSQLCICFFGGEPTLNTEAINKICDHILNNYLLEERNKIGLTYTTNGIIFDDKVKETLIKMKSINENYVGIMISTDNDKEVYDKNRHLIGKKESGFDIVQRNIKLYKEFLYEVNGGEYDKDIKISTVLATPEQILNNPMLIQDEYKDILRRGKFLYYTEQQSPEYIEACNVFLRKAYTYLINKAEKETKEKDMGEIMESVFHIVDKDQLLNECQIMYTIDGNGDINWCNKHRDFENEKLSQEKMREYIFNKDVDNSHFNCVKEKFKNGELTKDTLQPEMWAKLISKFDMNVPIARVNIEFNEGHKNIYHFIKYMIGSTNSDERAIYIKNPDEQVISICKEYDIKILNEKLASDTENTFYIDQEGNLFFDEIFKDNKDMILTNLKEKHFMWVHTPTLLNSVNKYFLEKLSY